MQRKWPAFAVYMLAYGSDNKNIQTSVDKRMLKWYWYQLEICNSLTHVKTGRSLNDIDIVIGYNNMEFRSKAGDLGTNYMHYNDVIMGAMASQITNLTIVYSTVYSRADERKHQSSASLDFVREIHRWPVNFPYKMASNAENVSIWWRHHGICRGTPAQSKRDRERNCLHILWDKLHIYVLKTTIPNSQKSLANMYKGHISLHIRVVLRMKFYAGNM